jgi:hypothetical protein
MLDLLLGEGKRRGQEAEQWRGRADKAKQQLQEAQQLIREYQKVDIDSLDPQRFGYLGFVLASYSIIIVLQKIPIWGFLAVFRGPDAD